jgi:hypothetical protein
MAKKPKAASTDNTRKIAAHQARIRELQGEPLSRQQIRDIAWLDNETRQSAIEAWQKAVPKGEYCELASRQHKLIDDAAHHYNLPLDKATINLRDALTALHDLVAANAHRLNSDLDGDREELEEEKLRQQIIGLERDNEKKLIELQYTRGDAIPKHAVRDALVSLSAKLRTLGQTLARVDPKARETLNDFLDSLADEIANGDLSF